MSKILKIVLIAGLAVALLGSCIIFAGVLLADGDLTLFSDTRIEELTYTEPADAPVTDIKLNFQNAAITVKFDENADTLSIIYPLSVDQHGDPKTELTVTEAAGAVSITERSLWYKELISLWDTSEPKVTLTLPASRTYTLHLETGNGAITVDAPAKTDENGRTLCNTDSLTLITDNGRIQLPDNAYLYCAGTANCVTANGKIQLGRIDTKELIASSDNGEIVFQGGTVSESVTLTSDNGRITVCGDLHAARVELESDNGKLSITGAVTADLFSASTDNGDINVSATLDAQKVILESNVGDVSATLAGNLLDYTVTVETDIGDSNIVSRTGGTRELNVQTDVGDIEILFADGQ